MAGLKFKGRLVLGTGSSELQWKLPDISDDYAYTQSAYGNGRYLISAVNGDNNRIAYSTDGLSFTNSEHGAVALNREWAKPAYDPDTGVWCAVHFDPIGSGRVDRIARSTDNAESFTYVDVADERFRSVAGGNGVFIAISNDGGDYMANFWRSADGGVTWDKITPPKVKGFMRVAFIPHGAGYFIAMTRNEATSSGNVRVMVSDSTGSTWTEKPEYPGVYYNSAAYGNGKIMLVSNGYMTETTGIYVADGDASNLSVPAAPEHVNGFQGVGFFKGAWYVTTMVGENSRIYKSTDDGVSWEIFHTIPTLMQDIAAGHNGFIVVGANSDNRVYSALEQ